MLAFLIAIYCFALPSFAYTQTSFYFFEFSSENEDFEYYSSRQFYDFPFATLNGEDFSIFREVQWLKPSVIRSFCSSFFGSVDLSDYKLVVACNQPSSPTYEVWFAKPLSDESALVIKNNSNYAIAKGDSDVYYFRFQINSSVSPVLLYFTSDVKHGWYTSMYANSIAYSEFPIVDEDGNEFVTGSIDWNVSTDSDSYTATVTCTSPSNSESHVSVSIHNQKGGQPSESSRIPWSVLDEAGGNFTKDEPYRYTIDLQDFKDACSDMKTYDSKIYIQVYIRGYDDEEYGGFVEIDLKNINDIGGDGLFSERLEYDEFPDLSEIFEDFPPFPEWDPDHPLDSIWEIIKWVGNCLMIFGKNVVRFFLTVPDFVITFFTNLAKALYNLVYDIRRMLIYLFVPDKKNIYKIVKDKFPSLARVFNALTAVKNGDYSPIHFNLLGNETTFDLDSLPLELRNNVHFASTVVIRVLEVFALLKVIFKSFGVNPSSGGDE